MPYWLILVEERSGWLPEITEADSLESPAKEAWLAQEVLDSRFRGNDSDYE